VAEKDTDRPTRPLGVLVDMASSRVVEGPFSLEQLENWLLGEQEACA